MQILVAGATGVIGRRLIPSLVARGHNVVGMIRSPRQDNLVRTWGAFPVIADAMNEEEVRKAVKKTRPQAIIHQMTAFPPDMSFRRIRNDFRSTNLLRTVGLDYLLQAAKDMGVRKFVAQSFTGWPNARSGSLIKTEADPLDANPPADLADALAAIRYLEQKVTQSDLAGCVLRYGTLYGPRTAFGPGGMLFDAILRGKVPLVGDAGGIWSFLHLADAVSATIAALEEDATGVFNITDDHPAPVNQWLPYLAEILKAPRPKHVPAWLARLAIGSAGVSWMCNIRGSSNRKAKSVLGWQPGIPDWRDGFAQLVASSKVSSSELLHAPIEL